MGCIFFFKQKTAYEMRISDWSSDVCSSDLPAETCVLARALERHAATRGTDTYAAFEDGARWSFADTLAHVRTSAAGLQALGVRQGDRVLIMLPNGAMARSEEHTSELQSLMRTSYAVFCLKKKKKRNIDMKHRH